MAKSISDTDELVVVKESRKFKGRMRSCASPCLPRKSPRLTGTKNHLLLVARHPQYFLDYETSFAGLSITLTNIFALHSMSQVGLFPQSLRPYHESFVKIGAKEVLNSEYQRRVKARGIMPWCTLTNSFLPLFSVPLA